MKKIISFILIVAMIIGFIPSSIGQIFAAETNDDGIIQVKSTYEQPGDTVEVKITVTDNPGILGMTLKVTYDESKMSLTSVKNGEAFSYMTFTTPRDLSSGCKLPWAAEMIEEEDVKDGVIATLSFKVDEGVEPEETLEIGISYENGAVIDNDLNPLYPEIVNGYIRVIDYEPGDLNEDTFINTTDVVYLMRYIAGGYNVSIDERAADVNNDGSINTTDVVYIMRHIAGGYGVELKPATPKCSHTMQEIEAKPATCTQDGNEAYWYCDKCEKYFSNEAGTVETSKEDTVIEATGHGYASEWSYDQSYHWHVATCEHSALVSDRGEHNFGGDKACTVCGMSNAPDPSKPYMITYKLVEYNKQNGDTYLESLNIDNSENRTWFSATDSFDLKDPSCGEAYTFNGWYTEDGTKVTKISAGAAEDVTLYARWTERTFSITYNVYQTPVGEITDTKYLSYTPSKGLSSLPNPEIYNYVFLGWYTNDGVEVKEIPVGTTGNITLNPYLTSKRNLTKAASSLDAPIIIENSDEGVIYFTYEIGSIENVPLSEAIWTIQSVSGLAQQKSETVSTTISEEKATEIADTISKLTVDSATWTLSEDWNDVTDVSEEWASEQGLSVTEANEITKTESGTYSFTSGNGGCNTTTTTDGTTTVEYDSENEIKGNSVELNAKVNGKFTNENSMTEFMVGKIEVGVEVGGGYEQHQETNEHSGTDTTKVDTTVTTGTTTWNSSKTSSETKAASQSESVSKALSEIISNTKGYGKSYSSGGENSESQEFSSTDSKSVSSSSALTYFSSETKTTTTTYSTDGKNDGCYRLVIAGTIHVFGVVGYDVATQSYFTYTFNVLDDKTYEFLDYSPTLSFNDYQNGALPFEVPYFVHEYVTSKTVVTETLGYITDSTTGTAKVTSFGENIGTKENPEWVCPTTDVVVPSYIASGGNAYKVTEITENAFAGKSIRAIILSDYITEIPANAFKNCTELEQIAGYFTTIGDNAFSGCSSLENFAISPRTTIIGEDAFVGVANLKMNALNAEYVSANDVETTQKVIQSAVESGTKNVVIDISKIATNTVLTLDIPAIDSFELVGDKKVVLTDLKVTSRAQTTKLRNLTVANCTRVPLEIKDGDLVMDTVNIASPNFVLLLAKDGATVSLLRDSKLTSQSGNAIVAKNPVIDSVKDENVWGTMNVSGSFYYCGTEPDTDYMNINNGKLIELTENEFSSYIQGCFKITLDPNGGSVDKTEMTAFVGQTIGTLPVPNRTGYNFVGWVDKNGVTVTPETSFVTVEDVYLIAQWSAIAYKVNWNTGVGYSIVVERTESPYANAIIGTLNSGDVIYYGDVLSITYVADTGYTLSNQGSTSITVSSEVTASDIYASANVNSYTVSWNTGTGYSIVVNRTSSPNAGASIGVLNSGDIIYYGDVLSINYVADTGYTVTHHGITSVEVAEDIDAEVIYAEAEVNSYTYNIEYVSSNGTALGNETATYNYGTTNTICPPAFSGYETPENQNVDWDAVSRKTIIFTYIPKAVNSTVITGQFTTSPNITYTTTMSYRNRTATSVEVQITTQLYMHSGYMQYGVAFEASCGSVGTGKKVVGGLNAFSPGVSRSVSSGWITIPLNTTNATTISFGANMYNIDYQNNYVSGYDYAFRSYTWTMNIPAY